MAIALTVLIDRVAPETESAVEQTRNRFNQAVRQILRAETRLNLSSVVAGDNGEEREIRNVRVFVSPGMPKELQPLEFDENFWLAIELAPLRGLLTTTQHAMAELSDPIHRLMSREEFHARFSEADHAVWEMQSLTSQLLAEAAKFDLLKKVFAIDEDVLGLYSYRLSTQEGLFDSEPSPNVRADLYWGVIGLVSKVLGVSVEALTVKVLAHELAHAYTHIGADADGQRWSSELFAKADRGLKEGLAQYYTVRVLDRLARQIPEALEAYKRLLPHQPEVYSAHLPWLEHFTPEEVRDAMLSARRGGDGTMANFAGALQNARKRLRGK